MLRNGLIISLYNFLKRNFLIFALLTTLLNLLSAKQIAFPTAEGFGRYAKGGRGGDVYYVENLKDNGPGSLRYGIREATGPRTILFNISGTIELKTPLSIDKSYITIAGQSAPGAGIFLKNYGIEVNGNHIIIRHIRCRPGDEYLAPHAEGGFTQDAITIRGINIIVDHVSTSWSIDEVLSCDRYFDSITVQYSIIAEGLHHTEYFHNKYVPYYHGHSHGSLIKRDVDSRASYHHNLWVHNYNRNPAVGSYYGNEVITVDIRNNLIYNCENHGYSSGKSKELDMNYVGNYLIAGPSTSGGSLREAFEAEPPNNLHIYQRENMIDTNRDSERDWEEGGWNIFSGKWIPHNNPFSTPPVTTHTPRQAFEIIISWVGAMPWKRDIVDRRLIMDIQNGTGKIIDSQSEVGGYPDIPVLARPSGWDTDRDGMPDEWEEEKGLNPSDGSDGNGDTDGDGFTNLEEYLNSLCISQDFILPPVDLKVESMSSNQITLRWKDASVSETGFIVERSEDEKGSYIHIDTVGAGDTLYVDKGLEASTTYYYRISAVKDFAHSVYTDVISATTLP